MVEDLIQIDILNHADFCGEFKADQYIPGLRKFYNAVESVRSKNPDNTLLLDAGDEINRLLWYGKKVFDGLKLLKTDAMSLGNHEFDKGQVELEENIEYIYQDIPILCCNILHKKDHSFIKNVKPYTIIEKSGIKIGIIGVTTSYAEKMITYPNFEPFITLDPATCIHQYVPELRQKGAQIIIVLAHIGTFTQNNEFQGELIDLARDISTLDVDLLIGGHTIGDIYTKYHGVLVNKGGFSGKSLIHTVLYFDKNKNKVVKTNSEVLYPLQEKYDLPNQIIDDFVKDTLKPFDFYFNDNFADALEEIKMEYTKESALGNLFADATRDITNCDFAYFNTTSCGPRIPKGPINRYSIKQANYFDEYLQTTKMTGLQIKELFEMVHNPEIYAKNFNLYFSGLKVTIDHNQPYQQKVVSIYKLDGEKLKDDEILNVCTSTYMSSGGNDTRALTSKLHYESTNILIHEAIRLYLTKLKTVDNSIDHRYIFIGQPKISK